MSTFISQHHCKKCGHYWKGRNDNFKLVCPKCRKRYPENPEKKRAFNFDLKEGQERLFLVTEIWIMDEKIKSPSNREFNRLYHYARRKNKQLRRRGAVGGVLVWCETKSPDL